MSLNIERLTMLPPRAACRLGREGETQGQRVASHVAAGRCARLAMILCTVKHCSAETSILVEPTAVPRSSDQETQDPARLPRRRLPGRVNPFVGVKTVQARRM